VVEAVGSWLALVEVWGSPFGGAVFASVGDPALFFEFVLGAADQVEGVDVGASGGCPPVDVVYFAPVSGYITARAGAPAVFGMNVEVMHT
jgi:hypothetical protein